MIEKPMSAHHRLDHWQDNFAESARETWWLTAHQWNYGAEIARATAEDVRRKLDLRLNDRLLEIGAGSGAFLASLLLNGQTGFGFDFCREQVRCMDRFGVDSQRVKLGVAEACRIPVASESIDKVVCYSVAHYFPSDEYLRSAIAEMLRVVRPGGIVFLGDIAGVMERTRKLLGRCGLPEQVADGLLWLLLPFRHLFRMLAPLRSREGRYYRRSNLRRMLNPMPCTFEFLNQSIPGRVVSRSRFDIRLVRKN